jgi:hypothetical protein
MLEASLADEVCQPLFPQLLQLQNSLGFVLQLAPVSRPGFVEQLYQLLVCKMLEIKVLALDLAGPLCDLRLGVAHVFVLLPLVFLLASALPALILWNIVTGSYASPMVAS